MRILMVVSEFPAISETFVLDQITGLIDRGHHVDVLALRPRNENITHSQIEKYDLRKNVHYAYQGTKTGALPFLFTNLSANLLRGNFRLIGGAVDGARERIAKGRDALVNPFHFYAYGCKLLEISRPDVAICHFGQNGNLLARIKSVLGLNFPLATIFHGNDISEFVALKGDHVYDELFRTGQLFLPVSEFFRQRLLQLGCPAEKTLVQRVGIDLKLFPLPRVRNAVAESADFTFLSIGRMVTKKGQADAIKALAICKAKHPEAAMRLTIIGEGPLRPEIEALITHLQVTPWVHLAGALPRDKVFQHLAECDAFILPSVTSPGGDMEGFPVSIMEAMTMALPILSTYHSGIPELVQDGVNGFLAEEHDVETLAIGMGRLIEDRDLSRKMGNMGRAKIVAEMSLDRWNDLLAERLQNLTGENAPHRPVHFAS